MSPVELLCITFATRAPRLSPLVHGAPPILTAAESAFALRLIRIGARRAAIEEALDGAPGAVASTPEALTYSTTTFPQLHLKWSFTGSGLASVRLVHPGGHECAGLGLWCDEACVRRWLGEPKEVNGWWPEDDWVYDERTVVLLVGLVVEW